MRPLQTLAQTPPHISKTCCVLRKFTSARTTRFRIASNDTIFRRETSNYDNIIDDLFSSLFLNDQNRGFSVFPMNKDEQLQHGSTISNFCRLNSSWNKKTSKNLPHERRVSKTIETKFYPNLCVRIRLIRPLQTRCCHCSRKPNFVPEGGAFCALQPPTLH